MPIHFIREKPIHRKIKTLSIATDLMLEMWRGLDYTRMIKAEGIPEDARVVGVSVDEGPLSTIKLYVESNEFAEIDENARFPEMQVYFSTRTPHIGENGELIFENVDSRITA